MPVEVRTAQEFIQRDRRVSQVSHGHVAPLTKRDELSYEPEHVAVLLEQRPVEPADLVVLAVRIVVATLRAANLITHQQHWRADGEQSQGKKVFDLAIPQRINRDVIG